VENSLAPMVVASSIVRSFSWEKAIVLKTATIISAVIILFII
jgi:hypothetical protein